MQISVDQHPLLENSNTVVATQTLGKFFTVVSSIALENYNTVVVTLA